MALIPFAFFETWEWQSIDFFIVLHLIYLSVFCSALANYLYVYAMEILGVSSVSLFINLIPVISVFSGFTILQEPMSGMQILGGVVILVPSSPSAFMSYLIIGCDVSGAVRGTISKMKASAGIAYFGRNFIFLYGIL